MKFAQGPDFEAVEIVRAESIFSIAVRCMGIYYVRDKLDPVPMRFAKCHQCPIEWR